MTLKMDVTIWASIVLVAGTMVYSGYTSQDVEQLQDKAQKEYTVLKGYALNVKSKYVNVREQCLNNGEWEGSTKCQKIKEIDPKARKLWDRLVELDAKLKKANATTEEIQEKMERIEAMKNIAVEIAQRVGSV